MCHNIILVKYMLQPINSDKLVFKFFLSQLSQKACSPLLSFSSNSVKKCLCERLKFHWWVQIHCF